jgi:hypothetical protein
MIGKGEGGLSMPRVLFIKGSTAPGVKVAYTVDQAVGTGCPNRREDVLLVQHLLRIAWRDAGASKGFRPPGETEPLKTDGMFGPKTAKFIKFFQEEAIRRGANCATDQRVDSAVSGTSSGGLSGKFYTILAMNSARNARQAGNQDDISMDPGFPAELTKHFIIMW